MDADRFDCLIRTFPHVFPRRGLAGGLGLAALATPRLIAAKKKRKKKKVKRNSFGCVNVGDFCKNAGQCCSGICEGKQGKKQCRAHDTGGCQADQDACVVDAEIRCPEDPLADCFRTTGNASFCGYGPGGGCVACTKDVECEAEFGSGAACVACPAPGCPGPIQTACIPVPAAARRPI